MVALIQDKTIHNACYIHPSGWIFVLLRNGFADNMKTDGFASNATGEKEACGYHYTKGMNEKTASLPLAGLIKG